jgi:hypothetical protein
VGQARIGVVDADAEVGVLVGPAVRLTRRANTPLRPPIGCAAVTARGASAPVVCSVPMPWHRGTPVPCVGRAPCGSK